MTGCKRNHIGGPGVVVGHGCIHVGPLALASAFGVVTAVAAWGTPWPVVMGAFLFWPVFSAFAQWWLS